MVSVHKSSIRFYINKKKLSLDVEIFREILQICPIILGDLPLEHDILSFIRDLGYTGDITYLTNVNVDYLHQPWRAFSTIINKCLSGKETRIDKIRLSRVQMGHEKTQVYGAILLKELTNQAMLESEAYKTYYGFASGEKTPKPKIKIKAKVAKSDKKKQPAKNPKAKGLVVLSKVALTEAGYQKKQERLSHITCKWLRGPDVPIYDSKSDKESWGDSDKEDDDDNDFEEEADINDDDSDDNDEKDDDEDDFEDDVDNNDDDNNESDDERIESDRDGIPNPNKTNEEYDKEKEEYDDEFNIEKDEKMDEKENDEAIKELYKDVNVNLGNKDADMTDVDQNGVDQQNAS
nr:hypothetical protein [Tanacetum cinerariifolium]